MTQLTYFPSIEDRDRLLHLRKELSLAAMDRHARFHLHAYDYGWRRAMLNERPPASPLDPDGRWLDPTMVAAAEGMWRRKYNLPATPPKAAAPTPDDIAHVEVVCNQIRANLAAWGARNKATFGRAAKPSWTPGYDDLGFVDDENAITSDRPTMRHVADFADLEALQHTLGLHATLSEPADDNSPDYSHQSSLNNMARE